MKPDSNWFDDEEYWRVNRSFIWSKKRIEMSENAATNVSKLLAMHEGDSVLDLACGFGRVSIALAGLGFSTTGVDLNESFIEEASSKAEELSLNAHFESADMREYKKPETFDNVIIIYNSFGYFENPEDDRKVIRNCFESLKPGGKLLLQGITRETLIAHSSNRLSRYWFEESDGAIRLEEAITNADWTWRTNRWILINETGRKEYRYGMRIYSTAEYINLFASEGFVNPQTFGAFGGRIYEEGKDHLVLVVEKPTT